MSILSII